MKNEFKQYAIFLDIDGTLMGSDPQSLKANIDTIQKVRSLGHKVFISTGRARSFLPERINVARDFDGVCSGAGTIVTMGEKEIWKKLMPHNIVELFCRFSAESGINSIIEGEKNLYYFGENLVDRPGWIRLDNKTYNMVVTQEVPVEKFTVIGTIPKELYGILEKDCIIVQHKAYGEIIHKECGKGKALVRTADYLGVPVERTVAMGDSMNDFDMLEAAGISVAMGNSIEEIKQIADFTTTDVNDAGVANALIKIFNLK
ncbi:MAG: Cof-type HAD-IIB family hydrolase [Clostridia bacterium]|nr:Cof-type HAD-IIB family hydrolase [Clostridia bacterium]